MGGSTTARPAARPATQDKRENMREIDVCWAVSCVQPIPILFISFAFALALIQMTYFGFESLPPWSFAHKTKRNQDELNTIFLRIFSFVVVFGVRGWKKCCFLHGYWNTQFVCLRQQNDSVDVICNWVYDTALFFHLHFNHSHLIDTIKFANKHTPMLFF